MSTTRVGSFALGWGESLVWDESRSRLYFVDCAAQTVHWLDGGSGDLRSVPVPSMPTGIVPAPDGRLVVVLEDGLHVLDVDAGTLERLTPFPAGMGGRANDACADLDGNLVTGTLNLGPGAGSAWRFAPGDGWRMLDGDISNTNGPAALVLDGVSTLVIGDTAAHYFAYDYDAATGSVGPRRVFGDTSDVPGSPDGSTVDEDGGLWVALFGGAHLARFDAGGLDRLVPVPVTNPTDVTFGGPDLDRLYVTSVGPSSDEAGTLDGALLVLDGLGVRGRPEPRVRLDRV